MVDAKMVRDNRAMKGRRRRRPPKPWPTLTSYNAMVYTCTHEHRVLPADQRINATQWKCNT